MNKNPFIALRHVHFNLRGGFLIRPLIIAAALGCIGGLSSALEVTHPVANWWLPQLFFPSHSDPQIAQVILGTIAASMMTVVSIVLSILLMTLTLASMQYSPRILVAFQQDRVTQETLGIFLGTFTYCLAALPAARALPHPCEPVVTVLGAMLLALTCVAWLLYFINHISQAISVNHIVDKIAEETQAAIRNIMPERRAPFRFLRVSFQQKDPWQTTVPSVTSGYVRSIDTKKLVAFARAKNLTIQVALRVGHFVPEGVTLLTVVKGPEVSPSMIAELQSVFDVGSTRTLQQDIEFGVLQIVDIALKALSTAVNDPSTAISCVDQLSRIVICFAGREPQESLHCTPEGIVQVSMPRLDFSRIVDTAFDQIHRYARNDVVVSLRLLRALNDIATTVCVPTDRHVIADRARRYMSGCSLHMTEEELIELRVRMNAIERLANELGDHSGDSPSSDASPHRLAA